MTQSSKIPGHIVRLKLPKDDRNFFRNGLKGELFIAFYHKLYRLFIAIDLSLKCIYRKYQNVNLFKSWSDNWKATTW